MAKNDFEYGMSLFSFLGEDDSLNISMEVEDSTEVEEDTLGEEQEDEDSVATLGVAASGSKDKPAARSSKKDAKASTLVQLPVTCYGRNWQHTLEGTEKISLEMVLQRLCDCDYKEVMANLEIVVLPTGIYFLYPEKATDTDIRVLLNGTFSVCDGLIQLPLLLEDFPDMSEEEISLFTVMERFGTVFPYYENKGLHLDNQVQIAIPVFDHIKDMGDNVSIPCTVSLFGERIELTGDLFPFLETGKGIPVAEIISYVLGETPKGLVATLYEVQEDNYIVGLKKGKKTTVSTVNREIFWKNGKDKGFEKAKELIVLPCDVYFVTLNTTIHLTSEVFGGEHKVEEEKIIDYLKRFYSVLRNKDRKIEVIYAKEQNLVAIALISGSKGMENELTECKLTNGLTLFVDAFGIVKKRVEVTTLGKFIAIYGETPQISLEYALPLIPNFLWREIVETFSSTLDRERIVQILWDKENGYSLLYPKEETAAKSWINYSFPVVQDKAVVVTIHSHTTARAYFSTVDDRDEEYTGIFGVLGTLHKEPTWVFRIGMEGRFSPIEASQIIEGL